MALALHRAEFFLRDFDLQFGRYLLEAGGAVAASTAVPWLNVAPAGGSTATLPPPAAQRPT